MREVKDKIEVLFKRIKEYFNESRFLEIKEKFKSKKYILISCIAILIVLFFGLFSGINSSKESVLEGFKNSLIKENASRLTKYVRVNGEKASSKKLEPLLKYYENQEDTINNLVNKIRQNGKSNNFTLENKDGVLKDKYYININTVVVELKSSISDIEVYFDNKKFNLIDKAQFDVIPGVYDVVYKHKTEYGDIDGSININVVENMNVDINLDANFVTLYSNFEDADVFINGSNTNLKVKDIKNYGPFPKDKDTVLYIQREFPWGTIKSDDVKLTDEQYIKLDINMVNDELLSIINNNVNDFYNTSFEAVNEKDKGLIASCTDDVKSLVYDYINKKSLLFSNNYKIMDLDIQIEKSDFKYEDEKYKASLVTKISYNVYKKLLPFVKTSNESSFILSLEYKDGTFIIDGIQKVDI